jgi:hypothetical protein
VNGRTGICTAVAGPKFAHSCRTRASAALIVVQTESIASQLLPQYPVFLTEEHGWCSQCRCGPASSRSFGTASPGTRKLLLFGIGCLAAPAIWNLLFTTMANQVCKTAAPYVSGLSGAALLIDLYRAYLLLEPESTERFRRSSDNPVSQPRCGVCCLNERRFRILGAGL